MRFATATSRITSGARAGAAFAAGLALASPSVQAQRQEAIPLGALRVAVDAVLAGGEQSLELVLLVDPGLGGDQRRQATVRELEHLLAPRSGNSAAARARRDGEGRKLESNGGTVLDPAIEANVRLYRRLAPFFSRHSFDCNQRAILHLEAARRLGIPPPAYACALDHAGLIFEDHGLVLDPYDGKLRTMLDFARGRGQSAARGAGYFLRTPRRHYLVVTDRGGPVLRSLSAAEHPDLVAPLEPLASLLLDGAAVAAAPAAARAYAQLALQLDPTSADAHDTLGNVAADLDPLEAAAEYDAALALDPHSARVHYNLAVLLQTRGEVAAAEGQYRAALALQPTLLAAIENLAALVTVEPNRRDRAIQPGGRVLQPLGTTPSRAIPTPPAADRSGGLRAAARATERDRRR